MSRVVGPCGRWKGVVYRDSTRAPTERVMQEPTRNMDSSHEPWQNASKWSM